MEAGASGWQWQVMFACGLEGSRYKDSLTLPLSSWMALGKLPL